MVPTSHLYPRSRWSLREEIFFSLFSLSLSLLFLYAETGRTDDGRRTDGKGEAGLQGFSTFTAYVYEQDTLFNDLIIYS